MTNEQLAIELQKGLDRDARLPGFIAGVNARYKQASGQDAITNFEELRGALKLAAFLENFEKINQANQGPSQAIKSAQTLSKLAGHDIQPRHRVQLSNRTLSLLAT